MGEMENAYKVLIKKLERKRPVGKLRCRLEDNIKMGHMGLYGVRWCE
jgi:hypothetical protein